MLRRNLLANKPPSFGWITQPALFDAPAGREPGSIRTARELIAANKMDLAVDDEAIQKLMGELPEKTIYAISGASHHGIEALLEEVWKILQEQKEEAKPAPAGPWKPK